MEIDFQNYQLSSQLHGHEDDVRRICVCGNTGIATSSRDKSVRFWSIDSFNRHSRLDSKIMVGHTSFVGPLAWIPPDQEFPEGGIVSGGMDTLVCVWDLRIGERVHVLRGHAMQVTGIVLDDADIVSCSVDGTLKRWRNGQAVESWEAHSSAVQAVIKLPSGELVTGSSDSTLKFWKGKKCLKTFDGHVDTVRGLASMSYLDPDDDTVKLGVLSASHDGSLRLWGSRGLAVNKMSGHTSLVYSVDSHSSVDSRSSGLVASGSEDCLAKIWRDGKCVQSIEHPGCVWDVKFLENGDLVTACSDGVVRIWTCHQDRIAESTEQELYLSQLYKYKICRKRVGGLKLEELPGLHASTVPGASHGQIKFVREEDNVVAYSWNMSTRTWDKIGEFVDGPGDGTKRHVHDGREFDYVFDVDIGDGKRTRKLFYNRGDNPYDMADQWLLKENLPLVYQQQVVDFILDKTDSSRPAYKHIPTTGLLRFDGAQFDEIMTEISRYSHIVFSYKGWWLLLLEETEFERLDAIVKILNDTSVYHTSSFADGDIALLFKLLDFWPASMLFPVLYILQKIILHPDGAAKLLKHINIDDDHDAVLLKMIRRVRTMPEMSAYILDVFRVVNNLFKYSCFSPWLHNHRTEILDEFSGSYTFFCERILSAYSTLILNYSVLSIEKQEEVQSQALSAALEIAEAESQVTDSGCQAQGHLKRKALNIEFPEPKKKSIKSTGDALQATGMAKEAFDDELKQKLITQVNFYLSDNVLLNEKNADLKSMVCEHGGAELAKLCLFPRMRKYLDLPKGVPISQEKLVAVADALRASDFLTISDDGTKVGRRTPVATVQEFDARTIAASPLPLHVDREQLQTFFHVDNRRLTTKATSKATRRKFHPAFDRPFMGLPRKEVRLPNPWMQLLRIPKYRQPPNVQEFPAAVDDDTPLFEIWWGIPEVHYLVKEGVKNPLPPNDAIRLKLHYMSLEEGCRISKDPTAPKIPLSYRESLTQYLSDPLNSEHPCLHDPNNHVRFQRRRFKKHLANQNVLGQQAAAELMLSCHLTFQMADILIDMRHRACEYADREGCFFVSHEHGHAMVQMQAIHVCRLVRDLLGPQFQPTLKVQNVNGKLRIHEICLRVNEFMELVECDDDPYQVDHSDIIWF